MIRPLTSVALRSTAAALVALGLTLGIVLPRSALGSPVALSASASPSESDFQKELQELQRQLEQAQRRRAVLLRQLTGKRAEEKAARKELARLRTLIDKALADIKKADREYRLTTLRLDQIEQELAELEVRMTEARAAYLQRIRLMAERGRLSYLEVLLGAADFGQFLSRLALIRRIVARDVAVLTEYTTSHRTYTERQATLLTYQQKLASLKQVAEQRRQTFAQSEERQYALVEKLSEETEALEGGLEASEEEEAAIQEQIRKLQERLKSNFGEIGWIWPIKDKYRITSYFGPRRDPFTKKTRQHNGIDLAAPLGTPIYAAAKGVVIISTFNNGGFGNLIVIDNGNGYSSLYSHLSTRLVKAGEKVEQGQLIGRVGKTGRATGPNLHFEIQIKGKPQDPLNYLP